MSTHPGHLDLHKLGELLIAAASAPQNTNGMVISAPGALTIAARSLKELAEPFERDLCSTELHEAHSARVEDAQPLMAAHTLDVMAGHFCRLREAVAAGDAQLVGQFFNLYVFD